MNDNSTPAGTSQDPLVKPKAQQPLTPEQKAKQKKSAIGAIIAIIVGITLIIIINMISKNSAQKAVDDVLAECKLHGVNSTECSEIQKKKGVTCTTKGLSFECTKGYSVYY